MLLWVRLCRPVVDRRQSAIEPLHHAYISQVSVAVVALVIVVANNDLWSPRPAFIFAELRLDLEIIAITIGTAEPSIGQPYQGRGIRLRLCDLHRAHELPRPAPILRTIDFNRIVAITVLEDLAIGEHKSISREGNRLRHNRNGPGVFLFRSHPREKLKRAIAITRLHAAHPVASFRIHWRFGRDKKQTGVLVLRQIGRPGREYPAFQTFALVKPSKGIGVVLRISAISTDKEPALGIFSAVIAL